MPNSSHNISSYQQLPPHLPPPILQITSQRIRYRRRGRQAQSKRDNTISLMVLRRIRRQESEDGDDAADVAKAYHPPRPHRPLKVALQIHHVPTQRHRQCTEQAHGHEEDGCVFEANVVVDVEEDAGACECKAQSEKHEA